VFAATQPDEFLQFAGNARAAGMVIR